MAALPTASSICTRPALLICSNNKLSCLATSYLNRRPTMHGMATSTSTIPMPTRSTDRVTKAAAFCRRTNRHCKVKAVATSPRAPTSEGGKKDYYKVLSLERPAGAGAEEIKRAYRRLARRCHPDACPPSRRAESTERFLELRRAYDTLSDPARRVRYDAELIRAGGAGEGPGNAAFARDVWEAQLCALRARSERRQHSATSGGVRRRQPA